MPTPSPSPNTSPAVSPQHISPASPPISVSPNAEQQCTPSPNPNGRFTPPHGEGEHAIPAADPAFTVTDRVSPPPLATIGFDRTPEVSDHRNPIGAAPTVLSFEDTDTQMAPSVAETPRARRKKRIIAEVLEPIEEALKFLLTPDRVTDNSLQYKLVLLKGKLESELDKEVENKFSSELDKEEKVTTTPVRSNAAAVPSDLVEQKSLLPSPSSRNVLSASDKEIVQKLNKSSPCANCARSTLKLVKVIIDPKKTNPDKQQAANDYEEECKQKPWSVFKIIALGFLGAVVGFIAGAACGAIAGGYGAIPGAIAGAFTGAKLAVSLGFAGAGVVDAVASIGIYKKRKSDKEKYQSWNEAVASEVKDVAAAVSTYQTPRP